MIIVETTISNETGLHARPALMFVQKANQFKSDIFIIKGEKKVNAKSILGILSLGLSKGTKVKIKIEGEDEEIAAEELKRMIEVELTR